MTDWHVGTHCVCVKEVDTPFKLPVTPVKGVVYTVRHVLLCKFTGVVCLYLFEISNAHMIGQSEIAYGLRFVFNHEPGHPSTHFRPLNENRLDSLRTLLRPKNVRERV